MFDHVTIRLPDREAGRRFYEQALGSLGFGLSYSGDDLDEWNDFSLAAAAADRPPTRRLHIGFAAPDRERVDGFWRALTAAGHRDDGAPGPRPQYSNGYYGAFVLDPVGNSVEAVRHEGTRDDGFVVDHLWIRVRDVAESRRFYETIAPAAGIRLVHQGADRVRFAGGAAGSCSFVAGEKPTQNVHMAFGALDDAAVEAFWRAGVDAGFRSNGEPGERPEYHAGYHAAYLLDPDGHNVETVCHHRP